MLEYLLLCLTAVAGGAVNSVAGGGTLLTFPALVAALTKDLPVGSSLALAFVMANATSTVALVPGSVAGAWGYRGELREVRRWLYLLTAPSLLGGLVGTFLVIQWPDLFKSLVPWLILAAALLFALQPAITRWTGIGKPQAAPSSWAAAGVVCFQFVIAVYGGYFGAGIGILMLSSLAFLGLSDIHRMNALKTFLAACINGVSTIVFVLSGEVHWPYALAMAVASIFGGYFGARIARRLNRNLVRRTVIAIGFGLAGWYFYSQFVGKPETKGEPSGVSVPAVKESPNAK
jgi:uncharacterized membrane protein YfcA